MIQAKVVCDSFYKNRLTTVELTCHRFILAEINTHRMFSRNSASSRAIPIHKQIERVVADPAMPIFWGKNQAGMVAAEEFGEEQKALLIEEWLQARDKAVESAEKLMILGVHKQLSNRLLEPFMWHKVLITATEWDNFFNQRIHPAAQPEMRAAAEAIRDALNTSTPERNILHLPYIKPEDHAESKSIYDVMKLSVARCARVSYLSHDGVRDIQKDLDLFNKLYTSKPKHLSPFEMVALGCSPKEDEFHFNLRNWKSVRYFIEKEGMVF